MTVPFDLPFEDNPEPVDVTLDDAVVASGVVVLATVADTALGHWPALVFRFRTPTEGTLPNVVLLLDDAQADSLPALITSATAASMREARKRRT